MSKISVFQFLKALFTGVTEANVDQYISKLEGVFNSLGQDVQNMSRILTTDWSSTALGSWVNIIFTNVMYPIGLSLLALFFMLGFAKRAAMFKMNSLENILRVVLPLIFAKAIMQNAMDILNLVLTLTSESIGKLASVAISSDKLVDFSSMKTEWMSMTAWEFMKESNKYWPLELAMKACKMLAKIICYGRVIEVYMFTALSPIPLSTLSSEEYSHIGKKFFQNYAGICLQGLVIIIIFKLFQPLVAIMNSGMDMDVWGALSIGITLVFLLSKSGNISSKIMGGN